MTPAHGTVSRYTSKRYRCRCDECRVAINAYQRQHLAEARALGLRHNKLNGGQPLKYPPSMPAGDAFKLQERILDRRQERTGS